MRPIWLFGWCFLVLAAGACGEVELAPRRDASATLDAGVDASLAVDGFGGHVADGSTQCPRITASLYEHEAADRVWLSPGDEEGFEEGYYTRRIYSSRDLTEYLGKDGARRVTLYRPEDASGSWTANVDLCINASICGDGIRNITPGGAEPCEGSDLGGSTCIEQGFLGGGTLRCTSECRFDLGDCETVCGNGEIEPGEQCDGETFSEVYYDGAPPGASSCATYSPLSYVAGALGCSNTCKIDTSSCVKPACGNGIIEIGEDCDGEVFGEVDTCVEHDPAWESGDLKCSASCRFDWTSCVPKCGNGRLDEGEECDGALRSAEYNGKACSDFAVPHELWPLGGTVNFARGELVCDYCQISSHACIPPPGCYISGITSAVRCVTCAPGEDGECWAF